MLVFGSTLWGVALVIFCLTALPFGTVPNNPETQHHHECDIASIIVINGSRANISSAGTTITLENGTYTAVAENRILALTKQK